MTYPTMPLGNYAYENCTLLRVIDGDTIDVRIDHGFSIYSVQRLRLHGLNAPERGQSGYEEAKDAINQLLYGYYFTIHTKKDRKEKFGRYLAEVFCRIQGEMVSLNARMVELGLAEATK